MIAASTLFVCPLPFTSAPCGQGRIESKPAICCSSSAASMELTVPSQLVSPGGRTGEGVAVAMAQPA